MPIPHFAYPFRLGATGSFVVDEQDGIDEVSTCVAIAVATPVGSRIEVPSYGTPRYEFGEPNPEEIVAAVAEWEPRADIDVTVVSALGDLGDVTEVAIAVRQAL